ncbi:MAG: S41 family peptidase [Gemmatimonadaceae bacterium]
MNTKRAVVISGAVTTLALVFGAGMWWGDHVARRGDLWGPERLISTAIDSVRANALDALPSDELLRRAVSGMLRELSDPYAALLRPQGQREFRGLIRGDGQGTGLSLRRQGKILRVTRVFPSSPAAKAGIRAGDRVLSVNGITVAEKDGAQTDSPTTEPDSSHLVLFRAPLGDTLRVTLGKTRWHVPAVSDATILSSHVGYVALNMISEKSSDELEDAVEKLVEGGAKSLLLDLRGNGGGLFEEGVRAASLFLPRNALVVSLTGKVGAPPIEHRTHRNGRFVDLPLVLLVDARTASAAEIIAAALNDHHRAMLVGEPTYGKGLVQRVVSLTPELSMRMTTARWITPNGKVLERRHGVGELAVGGITPDVFVIDAARREAMAAPAGLTELATARLLRVADTAAAHALREGWAKNSSVPVLESRVHSAIDAYLAPTRINATSRSALLGEATRLATTRVLQVEGQHEAVIQYSIHGDHALRAGLELVAPGGQPVRINDALTVMASSSVKSVRTTAAAAPTDSSRQ